MKTGYDQFFKKAGRVRTEDRRVKSAATETAKASMKSSHELKLQIQKAMKSASAKRIEKRKKKPHHLLFISFGGFIICMFGLIFYAEVESIIKKVEVNLFGSAIANEGGASQATNVATGGEKPAQISDEKKEVKASADAPATGTDMDHLGKLQERKKELDQREEELNRAESELQAQRTDIEKKLKELEAMREQISGILKDRVKSDSTKVDTLVQVYSAMKPTQAAKIFETMDEDLAIEILGRMKKKVAADIMNLIKPEKAQMFSEKFAGYRVPASK